MNVNKLKGKLVEKGLNIKDISKSLGISPSTFYRKISKKDGETFSIKEAKSIISIIELNTKDIQEIFFCDTVA